MQKHIVTKADREQIKALRATKRMELHPLCKIFPQATEREINDMVESIRRNGLRERGQQFHGGEDSSDVVTDIPGIHVEVKCCEKLSVYEAMRQTDVPPADAYTQALSNAIDAGNVKEVKSLIKCAEEPFFHTKKLKGNNLFVAGNKSLAINGTLCEKFRESNPIKPPNRNAIVRKVQELLQNKTSFVAVKVDFKQFYESIPREKILKRLLKEKRIDRNLYDCTRLILSEKNLPGSNGGLPRGLGICTVLSEYFMEDFDKAVPKIKGVYYYARYVDDLIILTSGSCTNLKKKLLELCPPGLEFNRKKSFFPNCICNAPRHTAACKRCRDNYLRNKTSCQSPPLPRQFDLLGYNFTIDSDDKIDVSIAPKKIARIKARIVASFISFMTRNDEKMLIERIEYLSSNVKWYGKFCRGLAFWYPRAADSPKCHKQLDDLTFFLRRIIKNPQGRLKGVDKKLSKNAKNHLSKINFKNRFVKKFLKPEKSFENRLMQILSVWKKH